MEVFAYAALTPREYRLETLRAFSLALCRAFHGMRRSRVDARVVLPSSLFPTQLIEEMVPMVPQVKDSEPYVAVCQDRVLYLRPVNHFMMGVVREKHGGSWLSAYLMWLFLVGED